MAAQILRFAVPESKQLEQAFRDLRAKRAFWHCKAYSSRGFYGWHETSPRTGRLVIARAPWNKLVQKHFASPDDFFAAAQHA